VDASLRQRRMNVSDNDASRYAIIQDAQPNRPSDVTGSAVAATCPVAAAAALSGAAAVDWKRRRRTAGRLKSRRSTKIAAINDIARAGE